MLHYLRQPGNRQRNRTSPSDTTTPPGILWGPAALEAKRRAVRLHQARIAQRRDRWIQANTYFYESIKRVLRFIVQPQCTILCLRSQTGCLMQALNPASGVGVELTPELAGIGRKHYPDLDFLVADPEEIVLRRRFDYILFDQISDTPDVLRALQRLPPLVKPHSRLVISSYNHLWEPAIRFAEWLHLKMPQLEQNWLSESDIINLLRLADFEWLRTYRIVLFPKRIPLISEFVNRIVARLPLIDRLCMLNIIVARPAPPRRDPDQVTVSVIVPCKNERGNIEPAIRRIPDMGKHTEIIFCDDQSSDGTADEVRRMQKEVSHRDIRLIDGPGICKAQNVWTGFFAAAGDVLMILDADLTVMPEELPFFFDALIQGKGEFINGSRMVYPMRPVAMKFANMVGNKFFSYLFSYLLSQPIRDTLCGTKVLWRTDWRRIEPFLGSWGVTDRWGDYELLFGATKLHLKIVDLPVHYQDRVFGSTKMVKVFRNGLLMLRMCWSGFKELKVGY